MADESLKIQKLTGKRTELIDRLISIMESRTGGAQSWLIRKLVEDLVDRMDKDGDRIKNTQANKRLVSLVDTVFNQFAKDKGLDVVKGVVDGVGSIVDFNSNYFKSFADETKLGKIQDQVKDDLGTWLGIDKKGRLKENGYLQKLVSDDTIRNKVKDMVMTSVVGQAGYQDTKNKLKEYITGGEGTDGGALKKYYRNFVYDTFSQVDRTNAKLFADKLGFRFAIYEGGLIKTSRKFCREHNGKVFHRDEIADFDITEARPPGYNPFTDLGGYGCRHHLNWIPDALAYALRPELRTLFPPGGPAPAPTPEPAPGPKPKKPKPTKSATPIKAPVAKNPIRPGRHTPFDQIVIPPITKFKPTVEMERAAQQAKEKQTAANLAKKKANEKSEQYLALQRKASKMLEGPDKKSVVAEMDALMKEFMASQSEFSALQTAYQKAEKNATEVFRNALISGAGKSNVNIINTDAVNNSKTMVSKVKAASEFIRAAMNGYLDNEFLTIVKIKDNRPYYADGTININEKTDVKIIIHEMAHAAENHNAVLKAAVDFWERRTAGKQYKKLSDINKAFRPDEIYKEGGFSNVYIGKIYQARPGQRNYKGIRATEIISMGLEKMYQDPAAFYKEDKDYFDFIYSTFFAR